MLRITVTEAHSEVQWTLHGALVGPWVAEFARNWKEVRRLRRRRAYTIKLEDVTSIDASGEALLKEMAKAGARFTVNGVYLKQVIEHFTGCERYDRSLEDKPASRLSSLKGKERRNPKRGLVRD